MSLLKSIERLKRMHDLINRESTGHAGEFAAKIGISRSMLMENIGEMKELGAAIEFCPRRRSYRYTQDFRLIIGPAASKVKGGSKVTLEFIPCSPMALDTSRLILE